jgi:hypothetical protein
VSELRTLLAVIEAYTDNGVAGRRRAPEYALFSALVEAVEALQAQLAPFQKTGDPQ